MPLEPEIAEALGVNRHADDRIVAENLLRQANRLDVYGRIPMSTAIWMRKLAEDLGEVLVSWGGSKLVSINDHSNKVARTAIDRLDRYEACAAIAFIAPHESVPLTPARDVGRTCKAILIKQLPLFCRAVLRSWEDMRLIVDTDGVE